MKIAIIGQNVEAKKQILEKFLELCPDYGTLAETIYDEEVSVADEVKFNEEWTECEIELYKRIALLTTQHDKYKDKENVIFIGHSLDILVDTLIWNDCNEVSDEFVEKIIYWNQKLMKKLDLIYWLPEADAIVSEETLKHFEELAEKEILTADESKELDKWDAHYMEIAYNNIWDDYLNNFDNSVILPRHCPGIGVFESEDGGAELADIVQDLHVTEGKDTRLDDIAKLDSIIKDKKLLEGMKKVLMQNTIPLPSGERVTSGSISLDKPL